MNWHSIPSPNIRSIIAATILIGCLAGAWKSYHVLYMATPDYSFAQLVAAAKRNDTETTAELADETEIASQFFLAVLNRTDTASGKTQPLTQLAWMPLEATFSQAASQWWHQHIAGTEESDAANSAKEDIAHSLKALSFPFFMTDWHYQSASWSRQTGPGKAELTALFYNDRLKAAVPCAFTLERTANTQWRVTGLADAPALLQELEKAYRNALAEYNTPIRQQIDSAVKLRNISAQLLSADTRHAYLRLHYTMQCQKQVQDIKAVYELYRKKDGAVLYTSPLHIAALPDQQEHISQFRLNPLIPSQYALIAQGNLDDTESRLQILSVTLTDGTVLTLAQSLPE